MRVFACLRAAVVIGALAMSASARAQDQGQGQGEDVAPPPLSAEQAVAIDGGLKDLFLAPEPQMGPDVFGYAAVEIGATQMEEMWRGASPDSPPALEGAWAGLVDRIQGLSVRARAEAVNSFTNRHIAFSDDLSIYGVADHWASLEETIAHGRGDCEDFAIAKMQLLAAAGVPRRDLYVILVRDIVREIDHAVLAVRDGDRIYILDSANDRVLSPDQVRGYRPVVGFSGDARWTFGHRTTSVAAAGDAQPGGDTIPGAAAAARIDPSTPPFR